MGSPNFYTGTENLNLAVQVDYEDEFESDLASDDALLQKKNMEDFVNQLDTLFFHKVVINTGYHSGFQIYIENEWENFEKYVEGVVDDWNNYKSVTDVLGYEHSLDDCPYFRKNLKNVTPFELKRAINREYRYLHNALLQAGMDEGLGEVVGQTWTSSVHYPILSKKIN